MLSRTGSPPIRPYLEQMEAAAKRARVSLADACEAAGVGRMTLWRWRRGINTPSLELADRVISAIRDSGKR